MGLFSDAGNYIALRARQALDRVLPRRVGPAAFPPAQALPAYAGPAGEGDGAKATPQPNIQVITDWVVPSTLGWTLEAMQAAVLQLENGNLYSAHSLMLAMTRDATVGHGLMQRRMSLSALRDMPSAKTAADPTATKRDPLWFPASIPESARAALRRAFPEAITAQDLATAHSYTVMLGLAPLTQSWYEKTEENGETYWQWRSDVLETGHCQYRADQRRYYFIARDGYRELVDDGNAWALFKSLGDRRHHLDCAVRTLATLWFIVQEALRYWRSYNAEYGRPIKGLKVPDSHRLTEDVSQLVQQASGLYGGSVIILPQFGEGQGQANFDLKLIEAKSRGFDTFPALADSARNLITLYLVGVLETTGGSSASDAKAKTQLRVADRYTAGDARVEEDPMNRILRRWADFNGFDEAPEWRIDTNPKEDDAVSAEVAKNRAEALAKVAAALKDMWEMGVRISEQRIQATLSQIGVKWTDRGVAEALSPYLVADSPAATEHARDSVLVCWQPPLKVARALAVPGGEAPEELHLTIAVCLGASLPDVLAGLVAVVGEIEPADGWITGVASWPTSTPGTSAPVVAETLIREPKAGGDDIEEEAAEGAESVGEEEAAGQAEGVPTERSKASAQTKPNSANRYAQQFGKKPADQKLIRKQLAEVRPIITRPVSDQLAYVSLVDSPALAALRENVLRGLDAAGVQVASSHGYIPHVTRAYLPAGSGVEAPGAPIAIKIDQLSVWALNGKVRIPMRVGRSTTDAMP